VLSRCYQPRQWVGKRDVGHFGLLFMKATGVAPGISMKSWLFDVFNVPCIIVVPLSPCACLP
jgi:hypothetical protein